MWCYVAWYFMCCAVSIKCLSSHLIRSSGCENWILRLLLLLDLLCSFFHSPLRWTISREAMQWMDHGNIKVLIEDWTIPLFSLCELYELPVLESSSCHVRFRRLTRGRSKRTGWPLLIIDRVNVCRFIIITRIAQVQKLIEDLIIL